MAPERLTVSRRDFLAAVGAGACAAWPQRSAAQPSGSAREIRIRGIVREFEEQGIHRTGTAVDRVSAEWLRDQVREAALTATLEPFELQRVDLVKSALIAGDRDIDGIPLFDGAFTDDGGVRGRLGLLNGDAEIGFGETAVNAAGAGALGDARRASRHRAIVCVTRGGEPGLCPSNADSFLQPFGPPVLQVSSEHAEWLRAQARQGAEVQVIARVTRTPASAFNVTATASGSDASLPPFIIMTPRSGWYTCASERGGGIACWLELIRAIAPSRPVRDVLFVASSGHELGHLGINAFVDRRRGIVARSAGWIHLGANIGAARFPAGRQNMLQASDDRMDRMLTEAMAAAGLAVTARAPRDRAPGGEAEVVHRGGGRYVSIIGGNTAFHNPSDRGLDVVDPRAIARFVDAFAAVAKMLAGDRAAG